MVFLPFRLGAAAATYSGLAVADLRDSLVRAELSSLYLSSVCGKGC